MVLNPRHKERVDNLETANQELDRLRKSLDKLQSELTEAHQEAEVYNFIVYFFYQYDLKLGNLF